ncbi:MAG: hypothetical protein MHM6MM_004926 [Cercozoa sp. M6MM]
MRARRPAQLRAKHKRKKKQREKAATKISYEYEEPIEKEVIPEDQIQLSEKQLEEEFTRVLTGVDPEAPTSAVQWSRRKLEFTPVPTSEHTAMHFSLTSHDMNKEEYSLLRSERFARSKTEKTVTEEHEAEEVQQEEHEEEKTSKHEEKEEEPSEEHESKEDEDVVAEETEEEVESENELPEEERLILNQFNFQDRGMQTCFPLTLDRAEQTEPPPTDAFSDTVSKWSMYDFYITELVRLRAERQREKDEQEGAGAFKKKDIVLIHKPGSNKDESDLAKRDFTPMNEINRLVQSNEMRKSVGLMERVLNFRVQNTTYKDFKYFDQPEEDARHGFLLPLWQLPFGPAKKRCVTSMHWNPRYHDLVAIGYGSFEFQAVRSVKKVEQQGGLVCIFSLKKTNYPELVISTPSPVTSVRYHSAHPQLLAVGMADGSVAVYDTARGDNATCSEAIYATVNNTERHREPVWQVWWKTQSTARDSQAAPTPQTLLSFFSVSSDGTCCEWMMAQNELLRKPLLHFRLDRMLLQRLNASAAREDDDRVKGETSETESTDSVEKQDSRSGSGNAAILPSDEQLPPAGAMCMAFSPHANQEHIFLVGTQEGFVHRCSLASKERYLQTFIGHETCVHRVAWNPFDERVFASVSADWTLKVWSRSFEGHVVEGGRAVQRLVNTSTPFDAIVRERAETGGVLDEQAVSGHLTKPLLSFDLRSPVSDVAWAPYSSTVLAVTTYDGRVLVFDLSVDRQNPLCQQKIVKKGQLTQLSFNAREPVLVVGDNRGNVMCLKLSQNLCHLQKVGIGLNLKQLETDAEKTRIGQVVDKAAAKKVRSFRRPENKIILV